MDTLTVQYRTDIDQIEQKSADFIAQTWSTLDLTNVATTRDAMIETTIRSGIAYGEATSLLTAQYYDETRADAKVPSRYTADIATNFDANAVDGSIRWAVDPLNNGNTTQALALVLVVGATLLRSIGSNTIRQNVTADPRAVGWHRIARPNSCDFCVMLSQRGAVYKKATADFAAHDNDRCTAKPSWDPSAPEVDLRAYEASQRTSHLRALDALDGGDRLGRHQARIAGWIEQNAKHLDAFRSELT